MLVQKILGQKYVWSKLIMGPNIGSNKFWVQIFQVQKVWVQNNVESKQILGPKIFWV